MATLVFGMNQSLDGYVDHMAFGPDPALFRHFIEQTRGLAGSLYGREMYEWVASRSLTSVGPHAELVGDDLEGTVRRLKAGRDGRIDVAGPALAHSLAGLGLLDEYQIYLHPVVIGSGKPYFAGARPPLHLVGCDRFGDDVVRLTYVPA
jgi:dihydrofolate reductase